MAEIFKIWNTYIAPAVDEGQDIGSLTYRFEDLYLSKKAYFRDASLYIASTDDGYLDLYADTRIRVHSQFIADGYFFNVTSKLDTYTTLFSDDIILCDGTWTLSLLNSTGSGKVCHIKNVGTGMITVDGNAGDLIDGELTILLANQYNGITVVDGALHQWYILTDNR
jgi:hypothetical protein